MRLFQIVAGNKIAILSVFLVGSSTSHAEQLPQYTGNYIDCGGRWCKLPGQILNKLTLGTPEKGTYADITYPGFLGLPDAAIEINSKKPRILLYSGRQTADPQTTALVELAPLPFNNRKVVALDRTNYQRRIVYAPENFRAQLWVMKREIPLRFKPVKGEVGMYIYEPAEALSNGFYGVDSGRPGPAQHTNLRLSPVPFGGMTHKIEEGVLMFIVGNRSELLKKTDKAASHQGSDPKTAQNKDSVNSQEKKSRTTIDGLIEGVFKKR